MKKFSKEDIQSGNFVTKDEAKREVTGPVAKPDCPDCDFLRGEKLLSVDEIRTMMNEYDTNFRYADEMHVFNSTKDAIGYSIKNWQLTHELKTTDITGKEIILPAGTWMSTVKVTNDDTWAKIQSGELQGFSAMYVPEETANKLKALKRTLIKDLGKNPSVISLAVVDKPCIFDKFTSVKTDPANKAGRSISNATLDKIQSTYDNIVSSVDSLKDLISKAKGERPQDKEVLDMELTETELNDKINTAVEKAREEDQKELKSLKSEVEKLKKKDPSGNPAAIKCTACKHELTESDKFCPACGDKIESETPSELESLQKEFKEFKKNSTKSRDSTFEYEPKNRPVSKRSEKRDNDGLPKSRPGFDE